MVSLYIRYPHWASNGAIVKVNGKAIKIEQTPGSYITVNRKWNSGDKVEITYPMSLRLEPTPDNPKVAAVTYGPIVLAGEMGTENMKKPFHDTSDPYQYYNYDYKIPSDIIHDLKLGSTGIAASLKPVAGKPLTFTTTNTGNGKAITLSPYYDLHRQRYVVYWDLN